MKQLIEDHDLISRLLTKGVPRRPPSRSTKKDLWREIDLYRDLVAQIRDVLLCTIVAQLRAGMNDGVTAEMLRSLADQLEKEQLGGEAR